MSKGHVALALAALLLPVPAAGQVGHDPAHSPFHPITLRSGLTVVGGYLAGSGGKVGVGPADGYLAGLRYDMRLTGPTDLTLGLTWNRLQRMVPHPSAAPGAQLTGPVRQSVVIIESGLSILLTGDKTWKGLAPYLGGTLGLAFGQTVAADSSGFRIKTKFLSGPHLGLRYYASQSVFVRLEGRLLFWQLKYPTSFFETPTGVPDATPLLDPAVNSTSEWTAHPSLQIGLGFAFRL
jgi:hypothetical protein